MGSSKTGSLDAFAPFSLPAALASGKVKLPATGVVGMLQKRQEDKMTKNAANMAGQPQQTPYDQMMMQMMGQQKRPEFMSPYSPAPYANGGNVALRRKMFKLGGSASAHGTGLTSGLAFNEGGSVKPGPDGKPRQHAIIGGIIKAILGRGAGPILRAGTSRSTKPLSEFVKKGTTPFRRGLRRAELASILAGGPVGIAGGLSSKFAPDAGEDAPPAVSLAQDIAEGALDISPIGLGYMAGDKLFSRPSEYDFETLTGKSSIFGDDDSEPAVASEQQNVLSKTVAELQAEADVKQREDLQAAMEMYQELIRGEDNTNKLMTLGDAAIAAGAALMEGEGYGGAATAFNEPLAQARMTQAERDQAAQSAAAQLAIGEDMSRRQADEALFNQLAAEGDLDSAEEIRNYMLATKFGVSRRVPENEKGELDLDAMKEGGAAVYADPKLRLGGLFIAVDANGTYQRFNSAEEAQQYAKG